jgi:molybdopterin-containing oxidoreductase family membrane subunit
MEAYFTTKHFDYLARLMAGFGALYVYFTFAEYLAPAYKLEGGEGLLLQELFAGRYAVLVWTGFGLGQVLPLVVAAIPRLRTIPLLFVASVLVNYGMWVKRFVIVVPSLALPLMPYQWGVYTPTWVEIAITLGSFGAFALVITLFARVFPIVSLWEMEEGREVAKAALPSFSLPTTPVRR